MSEGLTISITELQNGVKSTLVLSFTGSVRSVSKLTANSITDLLRLECIKRGLVLNIAGETLKSSSGDGSSPVSDDTSTGDLYGST